ncbi:hypothetical protein [Catellatospora tritici]|uniref:hypothetical protein n=1 Tax=Catellatospora tritici TaxID=2851566 RepID=UPI001C2D84F1|nr:hypothetical protein [Catellatospora tritici]MBV1851981.1 hypothetical protein [Catellatospora tritici]
MTIVGRGVVHTRSAQSSGATEVRRRAVIDAVNRRTAIFAAGLAVVIAAGYGIYVWQHNRPPFEAVDIHPVAVVEPLEDSAKDRVHYLQPGGPELVGGEGHQMLRGEVTWKVLPGLSSNWHEDGWFEIVIVDKRSNLKPSYVVGTSASGLNVVSGDDGVLIRVAEKYPWLRGAGGVKVGENRWHAGGLTLATAPAAGSVQFLAHFPQIEGEERRYLASAPIAQSDILIALVFIGSDRQVYWAERLYG